MKYDNSSVGLLHSCLVSCSCRAVAERSRTSARTERVPGQTFPESTAATAMLQQHADGRLSWLAASAHTGNEASKSIEAALRPADIDQLQD